MENLNKKKNKNYLRIFKEKIQNADIAIAYYPLKNH